MLNIQKSRNRAALFGGCGGFLGWILGQIFCGTPVSFAGTVFVGAMAGLGIGAMLGASEGITSASASLLKRGLKAGVAAGLIGGAAGAFVGQLGFQFLSGTSAQPDGVAHVLPTVFSSDVSERLAAAGAKSGEIEVSLIWNNLNDLDLHVISPGGERVYFGNRISKSGGELDVDRNAGCSGDVTQKPIEHVVWTSDSAPSGVYQVAVHHYMNCGPSDPSHYRIEVKIGDEIVNKHTGVITYEPQLTQPPNVLAFTYASKASGQVLKSGSSGSNFSAVVGRLLGWIVFGLLVGCAEGVKRKSRAALVNAALGGTIGGCVGGILFQVIPAAGLSDSISRLAGFVALGASVGIFIAIIDQLRSSFLVIEGGRFAGREIAIDKPLMRLGRSDALEIYIGGDPTISPHHATIEQHANAITIAAAEGMVQVNGIQRQQGSLKDGDRLAIGSTIMAVRSQRWNSIQSNALTALHSPPATSPTARPNIPPPPPRRAGGGVPPEAPKESNPSTTVQNPSTQEKRPKLPPPPRKKQ